MNTMQGTTYDHARSMLLSRDAAVQLFVYLQALDFLTTILGFRVGASEASPFIRALMHAGPVTGVLLSKLVAFGLAGLCLYWGKRHLLRWANYWYAGLIVWNLFVTFMAVGRIHG